MCRKETDVSNASPSSESIKSLTLKKDSRPKRQFLFYTYGVFHYLLFTTFIETPTQFLLVFTSFYLWYKSIGAGYHGTLNCEYVISDDTFGVHM